MRVLGVVSLTAAGFTLILCDWSTVTHNQDHVFSAAQRGIRAWWSRFIEMDEADVAKARSVARQGPSTSWLASSEARANFAKAAARAPDR